MGAGAAAAEQYHREGKVTPETLIVGAGAGATSALGTRGINSAPRTPTPPKTPPAPAQTPIKTPPEKPR